MWEPLFCTEVTGVFREPYLVPPSFFSFLDLCKRLQPPSSPGMPGAAHPQLLGQVESPRGRECASSLIQLE